MVRRYDASRRAAAAAQTREAILEAAFRLHGRGIFDLESLAAESGVPLATIRKHFPNRELLFTGCTGYGRERAPIPDVAAISAIEDDRERLTETVRQAYAFNEALFGQIWGAYRFADESEVLAATIRQREPLLDALAQAALPHGREPLQAELGAIRGMLAPLAHRALRVDGRLSPAEAVDATVALLAGFLGLASATREGAAYR